MTEYRTEWRNIGLWLHFRLGPSFGIKTPWGNLIVKSWADRLFSERYTNSIPHFRIFGLCVSWVRLRHFRSLAEVVTDIQPQQTPLMDHLKD